ncbi:histidine kinase [Mesotoga sp. HF07.pep.5.2.highcov]|uniref:sensor histidine kinase n=1 Tax=Mesotoga TaxID=1184396 RepID=UPI0002CA9887|nr:MULTISPECIES: HAMP domain-containing sensor histidine kinase [Mesotoga]RLL90892.1 histidine kinase [Mesotoga sp. HF07.pep.5.2.highcov]CCU85269.1 Integral membrane sensor signal transduction histidine kinase [Mesotoga infera]HQC13624.1 HAMP domain-containing sensor histidine kinase [Mesotoga prima]
MKSVTGEGLSFRKAKRRWTLFFTLIVVSLVSVLSLFIFVLSLRLERGAEITALNRVADRIESRIGRAPLIALERMLRNYSGNLDLFTAENEILEFVTPDGESVLQLGGRIKSSVPLVEGTSKAKVIDYNDSELEYNILTRAIRNMAGQPVFFLRVGRSTEGLSEKSTSLLFSLILLIVLVAAISWIVGMALAGYVLTPLRESYDRLQRFTADASHELKTPLTVMRLSVDLLKSRPLEGEARDKVDAIDGATRNMQNVVNQLLLQAKAHNDSKAVMSSQDVKLLEFLEEMKEYHRAFAESKGVRIIVETDENLIVKTYLDKLKVAVAAVLENAIKFTDEKSDVIVRAFEREGSLFIQIGDSGPGIADPEKERIFDRFYKIDESHNSSGSGMGLSIAKEMVGSLEGEITVENRPGGGSVFEIRIPLRKHK